MKEAHAKIIRALIDGCWLRAPRFGNVSWTLLYVNSSINRPRIHSKPRSSTVREMRRLGLLEGDCKPSKLGLEQFKSRRSSQ